MKLVSVFAAILTAGFACSVNAQTQIISENVLTPAVGAWTGSVLGQNGGFSGGGNGPAYNPNTNTLIFGYTTATATQRITAEAFAIQHALDLSNSGIKINGYNYSWLINNSGQQSGTLTGQVNFLRGTSVLRTDIYNYDAPTNGFELRTGTQTFANQESMLAGDSMTLSFTGKDDRFWAGYYGPQVRQPSLTLNYTTDPCMSNPAYSPSCAGYQAAYQAQMCAADATYNSACPGYAEALFTRQCTASPLSSPSCPGYAPAYLAYQCTANPLYSTTCPGYEQAYLNSQCIIDSLYSNKCEGYATAYAIKYLVTGIDSTAVNQSLSNTAATKANDPTNVKVATNTASTTINTDGSVSTGVSKTGDSNVDKAIAPPPPSANSATAPAGAVQLAPPPPAPQQQMAQNEPKGGGDRQEPKGGNKQEDKKDDTPKSTGGSSPSQNTNTAQASSDKPAAPTARQEIQARREAAAKAEAVEKGKNLANEMGKAADMETQKAVQNVVIQAMGFTPGFDVYNKTMLPDVAGYKPYSVYNNQKTVDNERILRGMSRASDKLHESLVDSQYK